MWLQNATARMDGNTYCLNLEICNALGDINGDGYGDLPSEPKKRIFPKWIVAPCKSYGPLTGVYEGGDYHGVIKGEPRQRLGYRCQ